MKEFVKKFFDGITDSLAATVCTVNGEPAELHDGIAAFYAEVRACAKTGRKVIYIGNGGSASIASHMSVDLWKNGGVKSQCFNDPSLLTCLANDLGYEHVFSAPTESFAEPGDIMVAISSSGKSPNILNAAKAAVKKGCVLVTCSGFKPDNPLRGMGKINFYVPSMDYGVVETVHSALCHAVVDCAINDRS